MKKIKSSASNAHFKKPEILRSLLIITVGITLFSCAKDKELDTVYKEAEIIEKSSLISTDETYLYVPSTLQVPRTQGDTRAYFQGDEKLVKFKYSEKNLEIFEMDSDARFRGNELNSSPVISIPVVYKDYKCKENAQKECSQIEEENTETNWNNKRYVLPDYSELKINEVNTLDLISVDPNCAKLTNTKLVNYETNDTTLNIELERTYQTSSDMRCIFPLYANNELGNASFKVRYFYSFVKLSSVASPDFKPFVYEKEDQRTFGFFKTEIKKLNKFYDFARIEKQFLANYWNPDRKTIDFYLDPKFFNEENKNLLAATKESFQKINDGFKQAGATIQINIAGKATQSSGDIRFSRINLLDEPQASGLLGYGPSVSNPLTGEIVQAHINMYSGVLTQTIRSTYESMVDLGVSEKSKSDVIIENTLAINTLSNKIQNYVNNKNIGLAKITTTAKPISAKISLANTKTINSILDKGLQKKLDSKLDIQMNNVDTNSLISSEDKNNLILADRKMCDSDLINVAKVAKKELPNIRKIPGVVSAEGKLLAWDLLTEEARQGILDLILPKVYIQTLVHEIGHTLGLRHNFMGSYDKANFYTDEEAKQLGLHTTPVYSSIMDYSHSELNSLGTLGKYDIAALRFMYTKKVETQDGQLVDVKTSIRDLSKEVKLKNYLFCTDENAGLSAICNRFDEGSTLTEIALSQAEAYDASYKYSYYRNGRNKFDIYGADAVTRRRHSDFQRARQIFEDYELLSSLLGKEVMEGGCTPEMVEKYPVCTRINDTRQATLTVARMFLDIIKTPDLSCYVENKAGEKANTKELVNLNSIFESTLRYSMEHAPVGCFDPAVVEYFKSKDQEVLAQGGKYLNSVKENNPKYAEYVSDISIRGNFQDKLLAIQFLVTRYLGINGKEDIQGSMIDIKSVSDELNNYFAHIITGEKLVNPIKFTDSAGNKVDVEYSLSNDSIIPEPSTMLVSKHFGFPTNSNAEFNRLAILHAKKFSKSNDVQYRTQAQAFQDSISVVHANKFTIGLLDKNSEELSVGKIDTNYYLAASENIHAKKMIDSINSEDFLKKVDPNLVMKVMGMKTFKFDLPADYTINQKAVASLPANMIKQLMELKTAGASLTLEMLAPQVGEEGAKLILLAYELSNAQMQEVVDYIIAQSTPAKDASDIEKLIYTIDTSTLEYFLNGSLEKKNELYIKSLDVMSPLI